MSELDAILLAVTDNLALGGKALRIALGLAVMLGIVLCLSGELLLWAVLK